MLANGRNFVGTYEVVQIKRIDELGEDKFDVFYFTYIPPHIFESRQF